MLKLDLGLGWAHTVTDTDVRAWSFAVNYFYLKTENRLVIDHEVSRLIINEINESKWFIGKSFFLSGVEWVFPAWRKSNHNLS